MLEASNLVDGVKLQRISSICCKSNNQVGYIQLQPAIRSYTYNMNTYNNNSITATHSQFLSTAGYTGARCWYT